MGAMTLLETDVLVIGSGAAGMMAAHAAARAGAQVVLADKSVTGRGGATVLAQMTVAVALGDAEPDDPELHAQDTLKGSRGLADPAIVRLVTYQGPEAIREMERLGTPWARAADGTHAQVFSPGHSRKRCVYVDILNTGGAVSAALRRTVWRDATVTRLPNVMLTRLVVHGGRVVGAVGFRVEGLSPIAVAARQVIVATGGLTEIYERNSASANMTGDGFMLAAEAGAELREMELVQFFPIAHLFPPIVGLDPIMWDPFRYKLGGRLLNGRHEEFLNRYAGETAGKYTTTRDVATFGIFEEVRQGRGSPHGGAYLDLRSAGEEALRANFGPVIDILTRQGVDLTRDMVEVAPMAHFMLGGIHVSPRMETSLPGLYACGEAIQGLHGANRLSGNAITEALVTGQVAGAEAGGAGGDLESEAVRHAAAEEWEHRSRTWWTTEGASASPSALRHRLQSIMWRQAGPLRTQSDLEAAVSALRELQSEVDRLRLPDDTAAYALPMVEKAELENMCRVSQAVVLGALRRTESRGAHVRLDYPESWPEPQTSRFAWRDGDWHIAFAAAPAASERE